MHIIQNAIHFFLDFRLTSCSSDSFHAVGDHFEFSGRPNTNWPTDGPCRAILTGYSQQGMDKIEVFAELWNEMSSGGVNYMGIWAFWSTTWTIITSTQYSSGKTGLVSETWY